MTEEELRAEFVKNLRVRMDAILDVVDSLDDAGRKELMAMYYDMAKVVCAETHFRVSAPARRRSFTRERGDDMDERITRLYAVAGVAPRCDDVCIIDMRTESLVQGGAIWCGFEGLFMAQQLNASLGKTCFRVLPTVDCGRYTERGSRVVRSRWGTRATSTRLTTVSKQ